MSKTAVIALGGDVILRLTQEAGSGVEQEALYQTWATLVRMVADGWRLVITHGNGPQVGNILLQNERARSLVPAMPLDVCGAQSQGQIGYLLHGALAKALQAAGMQHPIATLFTRVLVDDTDSTFMEPVKAIGPIYTPAKAADMMRLGILMRDGGRGWRQMVPSPQPLEILEMPAIQALLAHGHIVIAGGGGGVPVVRRRDQSIGGVAAVVEKDLTSSLLGVALGADLLLFVTDVPGIIPGGEGPAGEAIATLTAKEARRLAAGGLPSESMGVKVAAAARFVEQCGKPAIITDCERLAASLSGQGGTRIIPNADA